MGDPTSRMRFLGDERDAARSMGRLQDEMRVTSRVLVRESDRIEDAFKRVRIAADRIRLVDVKLVLKGDDLDRAFGGIDGRHLEIQVRLDGRQAIADARDLRGRIERELADITVPIDADTRAAEQRIRKLGNEAGAQAGTAGGREFGGKFLAAMSGLGIGSVLAGIATDAFRAAGEKARVTANLQNQMGISPAEAKMYGDRVGKAYAGGLGDSKEQIATVYANLSTDVSDWSSRTMAAQDKVAARQVKVVQGLGVDMSMAIQASTAAVRNKLVPTFEDAQDLISKGFQTLGSRGEDWAETLQEYSQYFRNLGFDGATTLGLIKQGLDAGARSTDYMADAFKELNIRVIDGSKPVSDALKAIGLDAKKIPQDIAAGGPTAMAAVDKIIDRIRGMKDPIAQNAVGVALFGTQWEDTMKQVISNVDVSTAAMAGSFQGAVDKMTVATDTNVERFSRRWDAGLAVVGESLAGWANDGARIIDGFTNHMVGSLEKATGDKNPLKGFSQTIDALNKKTIEIKVNAEWQKVQDIHNRLKGLPPKTPIVVDALTDTARGDLERIGYQTRTLPGGKIEVIANTKPAAAQAESTVRWLNSLYANITVGVVGPGKNYALKNTKGGMAAFAKGGVVDGPGGIDNVPIWATKGEHIIQEKYASDPTNSRILDAINSGKSPMAVMSTAGVSSPPVASNGGGRGGGPLTLVLGGNVDSAMGTAISKLIRDGEIQVKVG